MARKRKHAPRERRRAAAQSFTDRELETVVQALVATRWAIAGDVLTPSPLGMSHKDNALQRLDSLIDRLGGPIGTGKLYHQQERAGVDCWSGPRLTGTRLPVWTDGDPARAALVVEYVDANAADDTAALQRLTRILEQTPAGMPSLAEIATATKGRRYAARQLAARQEVPDAFHDFIEGLEM